MYQSISVSKCRKVTGRAGKTYEFLHDFAIEDERLVEI